MLLCGTAQEAQMPSTIAEVDKVFADGAESVRLARIRDFWERAT
jgi:hypothetical protein